MVAKAWTDPAYRALMLEDGTKAAEELGIPMRGAPPLGVLENTAEVHNLVVCTLCSCYPRAVLGYPPFWFKSAAYRARGVRDPRGTDRGMGHRAAGRREDPRRRFHRRLSLDGAAAAACRHRWLERGAARGDRARRRHDRRHAYQLCRRHDAARAVALDQIQRPLLGLVEHAAEIFADDAECHELRAAQEQDDRHQAGIAGDRIAEQQRAQDQAARRTPPRTARPPGRDRWQASAARR